MTAVFRCILAADDPRHGTLAGERAERRAGQPVCGPCRNAKMVYEKRRRMYGANSVPACGTRRRIQALRALGHSLSVIAAAAGYTKGHGSLRYPALETTATVTRDVERRIKRAYDALSMFRPEGTWAETARAHAERLGWVPPLAWDDDAIDDPDAEPIGHGYEAADRHEQLDDLLDQGADLTTACRVLVVSAEALEKWAGRHGRLGDYRRLVARMRGAA